MIHTRTGRAIIGLTCIGALLVVVAATGRWESTIVRPVTVIGGSVIDAFSDDDVHGAPTPAASPPAGAGSDSSAEQVLDALDRTPDRRIPDYRRRAFGPDWPDVDGNGCSTRNDILARDLTQVRRAADGCTVLTGVLDDPYSGHRIDFRRGEKTSAAVQIDHRVPLALAWRSGAWAWTDQEREAFANDPANLIAVDGDANRDKSASGPGEWMPRNEAYRCDYDLAYVDVLNRYHLTVSDDDRDALRRQLERCR